MKGIVFTEFMEHVEATYGIDMADQIIDESDLPSGGVYTQVGTYSHDELITLGMTLCRHTGTTMAALVHDFGVYLGGSFVRKFGHFFEEKETFFELLDSIEGHIHVEVQKLYPDAVLPSIILLENDETMGKVLYRSPRGMDDLLEGLMEAAAGYYGDTLEVDRTSGRDDTGAFTVFTIRRFAINANQTTRGAA